MAWFNYLKDQGFFDSSKNPAPIKTENGYDIPYWAVLDYIEKIAASFGNSENLELIPEVLNIVKDVSENPVDNYKTFYRLIKILSLVPNEYVLENYLYYIPVWVDSQFDTMLQTNEICNNLLPKFLSQKSTNHDIKKAEIILSHLFNLKKDIKIEQGDGYSLYSYDSPYYLYYINRYFNDDQQIKIVVEKCSTAPIYKLLDSINILVRDTPISAEGAYQNITYYFSIIRNFEDLNIKVDKIESEKKTEIINLEISDYLNLNSEWLNEFLKEIFIVNQIDESLFENVLDRLYFNLNNDLTSIFGYDGIKDLDEEVRNSKKVITTFSLILRNWLTEVSLQPDLTSINEIFEDLLSNNRYNIPFFKRIILYVVSQNWEDLKPWFWKLIENGDKLQIFSNESFKLELYNLLSTIANKLNASEIKKINVILEQGPQEGKYYTPDKELWQHRWLHALKENNNFSRQYHEITDKNDFKSDYSNEGKITVRIGNVSPFTIEEISEMSHDVLIHQILNFKNNNRWDAPSIDGFADELDKSVQANPDNFTGILKSITNASYIYIYHILSGFTSAWKENKDFNWEEVLDFCWNYISSDNFINNNIINDDEVKTSKSWIYGAIAYLISTGSQNDDHSYNYNLLPSVKKILLKIISTTEVKEIEWDYETDFVMLSINSTQGKILKSLLDYSLKAARNSLSKNAETHWDKDVNFIYSKLLDNKSIEAYTFLGMYFQQFMYLDNEWLIEKINKTNTVEDKLWLAFMRGLPYSKPVSREFYEILHPHYIRAINVNIFIQRPGNGLLRHLFAYYLWDYEMTLEKTLLYQFLTTTATAKIFSQLVALILQHQKLNQNDSAINRDILSSKTLILWKMTNKKMKITTDKKDLESLRNIIYLNDYVDELNDENINLVSDNIELFTDFHANINNIKNILRWSKSNSTELISKLSKILKFDYVNDQAPIIELTEFLYKNEQTNVANKIANDLAFIGYDFLRPLFQKYNQLI